MVILPITRVLSNTQPCGIGCTYCREDNCFQCQNGYYLFLKEYQYRCNECPENCVICRPVNFEFENVNCRNCNEGYYLHLKDNKYRCSECPANCKTCSAHSLKTEKLQCETCMDGFNLHSQDNAECTCHDGYYLNDNQCKECPNGRWGHECKFSCTPCSECVSDVCTDKCVYKFGTAICRHQRSTCHHNCTIGFITLILENVTTLQTEAQTNGSGSSVLYIVIAVITGSVLTVVFVVIICVKRRKQFRRRDHKSSPRNSNNEAESRQLTDNAMENVSHHGNDKGNAETINVDESNTGYVNINTIGNAANINAAENNMGYINMNTIDNVATINVAESNTGYVDMNAAAFVNIVDKIAMNAIDTVNSYEALCQYTNLQEAENEYTAIIYNENVYYTVPN